MNKFPDLEFAKIVLISNRTTISTTNMKTTVMLTTQKFMKDGFKGALSQILRNSQK